METQNLVVKDIPRVEWSNQPVLTTAQLAKFYETTPARLIDNFNANKERFVEGKHFFRLEGDALNDLRIGISNVQISPMTRTLYLWTERGAARHAKMLNSDRAWEVFETLEDNYFNRPVEKKPDFVETFSEFVALENKRVILENDRLALEREKFLVANSEETKTMAKVQLLRELASASGENQLMRDDLIRHATILLVGNIFCGTDVQDKDIHFNKQWRM